MTENRDLPADVTSPEFRMVDLPVERDPSWLLPAIGVYAQANAMVGLERAIEAQWRPFLALPGFAAHGVLRRADSGSREDLIAFGFGMTGSPAPWWDAAVVPALTPHFGEHPARRMVAEAYTAGEVHVLPSMHGHGLGGRLLRRMLSGRPERLSLASVLSHPDRSPGQRLDESVGFSVWASGVFFGDCADPYLVMGRSLA